MFLEIQGIRSGPSSARGPRRYFGLFDSAGFPKLRFTLWVSYHMIVSIVVSSPAHSPNGKAGIMDIDLSHREPISSRNRAAHAVAVVGILATFKKPEAAPC